MGRDMRGTAVPRAAILVIVLLCAGSASTAERPTLDLDRAPSGSLVKDGGAWRSLPSSADVAGPRLVVEDGALPDAPALRARARIELSDAAAAAGVALVDGDGGWVAAGLEGGVPVLAPSDGRWAADSAPGFAPPAGPLWVELESVEAGATRWWTLRVWPEGDDRPEEPVATALERRRNAPGERTLGVWLAGAARVADLQALALEGSRSLAPRTARDPWPLELDRGTVRVSGADLEVREVSLESLDAAPKGKVLSDSATKTATSFPCNPYQHHFAGYAPGYSGSSALLHLPPVDNDCDGAFNEDPVNWRDDDGDGLVDEDSAWVGDGLLSWTSSDIRLGELATGDAGALILVIRLCWPTREYLTFATLTSDDIVLAGGVRLVPEGGGVALVGHDWEAVEYLLSPASAEELTVAIFESGGAMADGTWFERPVALTFPTSGGSGAVTVTATIDGVSYTPGAGYAVEGEHAVHVVATDGSAATATADGSFGIDLSAPVFSELSPASGEVVSSSPVVITGRVSADAVEVLVAGAAASLGAPGGATRPFTSAALALAEGPQVLELIATDRVGKTTSTQLVLDLDTRAPVLSVDSPAEGSLHPSQPVTVTGTFVEAHLASLAVNGVAATLTGDRFTAGVPLAEGGNTLTAVATDVFGRPGEATVTVVLDTTAPDISLETPADGAVVGESPITVTGHVEDPYLATVEVNGVAAVVTGTGFTAEGITLAEGPNTLSAVAADQVGNTTAAPSRVVVLDTLPPELTVATAGLPTLTAAAAVALSGTAVDPHLESVTVNGLPATVAGNAWSLAEVPLAEGDNILVVRAVDSLGHAAEAPPIAIVRDSQPPALVITEPGDGAQLTTAEVTVRGTVSDPLLDPASVVVNGVVATVTGDTFEATVALGEGETALVAEAADTLGHVGVSATVTVTIDTLPPVVTLTVPLDPLVGAATVAVMGTVHEPHLESLTVAGIAAVVDGSTFTVDGVPLDIEGDNPIVAVARDTFGHEASSNVVVYVRDTTAPEIAITEPVEGAVLTATTLVVTGTVSDAHLETVTVNGAAATVADGVFTAEIPASDGTFEIRAIATDAVGLTAEAAVTVLRDTLAPVVTIDQPAPAAGSCLAAGQPVSIAGSLAEASPATGLDGQPPPIRLEVVRSDGQTASFVGVLSPDGRSWSVEGVDLGSADGTAVATVIAADSAGQVTRASRSWRVDATAPAVTLLLDGAPFPGAGPGESPAPGAEPALLNRTVVPRVVVSDPGGAAPQPVLTLDGSSFAPGSPVAAEGDHLLVARATDCAGRETVVHAFFRLDLTAPQLLGTMPAGGALLGEGVETYSGTSDADLATATVNGRAATVTAGAFSVTPFAWREGENVVSLELVDEAGNRATFERRFTVRSLEPTLELLVDGLPIPPGAVFTRAVAPVVRCSDPEAAVTATLDGAPFAGGTLLDATGDHTLTATATDALDRTVSASVSFRVDPEAAPTVAITSPANGDVLPEAVATVTGSLTGNVETVTVNGLAAVVTGATFTATDVPLDPDGLTTLVAIAVDGAGRSDSDAVTVTVRSGAPQLLITEPEAGTVVARAAVDVAGLVFGGPGVTADGTVAIAGLVVPIADDGSFRVLDVPLAAGANTLEATATDDQGRTGRAAVTVVSDRTPPRVALTVDGQPVAEGAVFPGAISLEITVTDDDSAPQPPQVRLDGELFTVDGATLTTEITAPGGHLLEVVATDLAGNEMRLERSLVIGGSGCAISSLEPAEGTAVADDRVTLRGDVRDAVGVVVRVPSAGGDPLELDATLAAGTFVAGDVPLPEVGENVLTVVCTDAAGATAEQTLVLERLAGSGPVVVLTAPADGARLDLRRVLVTGTVDPATARVLLNGAEISVDPASGAFTAQLDLAEGPNVLAATAVDGAGRVGRDRVVVWRDTRAPQVRLTEPSSGTIVGPDGDGQATVRIAGVVDLTSEPHLGEVSVTTPAGNLPLAVDPVTGAFSAVVALDPALAGQPQQVRVSALDTPMGHEGVVTVSVTFDPAYPAIVLSEPAGIVLLDGSAATPITVTGEAWAAEGAQVSVNGAGLLPDQVSWQGPDASGRFHTAFSVTVAAPTEDGARAIVAQVTELGGARAQTLRTVVRDSLAPQLLELVPADGATVVDPDTLLFALFSEPVRMPSLAGPDGLSLERLATATATAVERTAAGTAVALVPAARLTEGESYRLEAGLGILDLVGNPLGNPGDSVFETAFGGVGAAPVLDALSEVVCAQRLTVAGVAAPGATLRLHDGDLALTTQADGTGRFAFDLPLIGPGFHLIRVAVVASDGREGASARAIVRVDCDGPTVERVELDRVTGVLRITLSEPIAPATAVLGSSVRVFDADGVERGAESLVPTTGDTVLELQLDPAADAWWRDAAVRVQVGPPLADTQDNTLAGVFQTVLFPSGAGGLEGGFLYGEAWDDATGRPLENAVAALYVAGSALPGTVPAGGEANATAATVTDARGRFTLVGDVAPGRYVLVLSAPGRTRVHRRLALEPGVGAVTFDSRLTPLADPAGVLDPISGVSFAHPEIPALSVTFDPNAVAAAEDLTVTLTPRSGQGLPDLLPLGWTPAAVAELRLETSAGVALPEGEAAPFAAGAVRLELPLPSWHQLGDEVVAVRHHAPSGAWLTLPEAQVRSVAGGLVAEIEPTGPGTVALVVPDAGDLPPRPEPGPGHALTGSPLPETVPDLTATLSIDPPSVLPTGRATARVDASSADASTPWPSGLAVQAWLEERLVLADGGVLLEAPVVADVLLYRCGEGAFSSQLSAVSCQLRAGSEGSAEFVVSPSERAAQVLLEVGWETVKVFPFPETLERGQTIGATGGTVTSADGIELVLPEGAVPVRTPVEVRKLSADELAAVPGVAGFDTVAAIRIELDGRTLAREATLKMPVLAGVATDATVILGEWIEYPVDGRGGYARLASRVGRSGVAGSSGERLVGAPEPAGSELPLQGIVREGLYLVLVAQEPIGYATGFVRSVSELGLADSRVTASDFGTADLSRPGGRYAVPVPTAAGAALTAQHPRLDERAVADVPALAAGEVVVVDLNVIPVPPTVTGLSPADGATEVTVGANLQVSFSEALDPATVGEGTLTLEVADASGRGTGAYVPGAVSLVNGASVLFQPTLALPAGFRFLAHFAGGVRDAGGVPYQDGPVDWGFTTSTLAAPGGQVHPELFHISIPVDGLATVWADDGAMPTVLSGPPWTVSPVLVNTAVTPATVGTYPADSLGGLIPVPIGEPPTNPVTLDSEVWVRIYDPTGTLAETFRLGPFASEDGLAFVAPAGEATNFTTADGIEVQVPEGAFDEATVVRVTQLAPEELGVEVPENLRIADYLSIEFEGEAANGLVLRLPAPADAPMGSKVLVGEPMNFPWGRRLRLLTIGSVVEEDPEHRVLTNDPEHQPRLPSAPGAESGESGTDLTGVFAGITESTRAAWFYKPVTKSLDFMLVTFEAVGNPYDAYFAHEAPEWVYLPPRRNWRGKVVLPLYAGDSVTIERRDVATGWVISRQLYTSLLDPDGDGTIALEALLPPDPGPPRLVAASHFDLISFDAPRTEGEIRRLRLDLQVKGLRGGVALVERAPGYGAGDRSTVAVYDTANLTDVETRFGHCTAPDQWKLPPDTGERLLAVVGPSSLDTGRVAEFAFTFSREITADLEELADEGEVVATLRDLGEGGSCGANGTDRPVVASFRDSNRTLVVQPQGGLVAGHRYRLELRTWLLFGEQACPNGAALSKLCSGPRFFDFTVQSVQDDVLASGGQDAPTARGLIKVGNLVFTGHDDGKVRVTDVSGGGSTLGSFTHHATISHPTGEVARAFATDGHGRVFYTMRHVVAWTLWTIDVNDVYAAAPGAELSPTAGDVHVSLGPAPSDSATSELLALGTLASGIPNDLELMVRDHESESMGLEEFCAEMGCSDQLAEPALPGGFYDVSFELQTFGDRPSASSVSGCSSEEIRDKYQRASVDNLTTGQTWSVDLPWDGGGIPVTVTARRGDVLRVRHNIQTVGYLAILGSGISVVDLNRAYRNPSAGRDWAKTQCGRRLAMYQGGDFDPGECGPGGLSAGMSLTTSVAVAAPTGCDTAGACRRSPESVEVFSPLMHHGLVQTSSPVTSIDRLIHSGLACLDWSLKLPSGGEGTLNGAWLRDAVLATGVRWINRGLQSPSPICDHDSPRLHEWQVDDDLATSPQIMEGDLLFVSLGENGILVFDVGSTPVPSGDDPPGRIRRRDIHTLIGHLYIPGHQAFRLQVDPQMNVLLAGGYGGLLDVWDLSGVNAAPGVESVSPAQPIISLNGVPWVADHLAVDHSGTGLLYTWGTRGEDRNILAIPVERPRPVITGVFRAPEEPAEEGGGGDGGDDGEEPPPRELRPVTTLVPLGVPTELSQQLEKENRDRNERSYTAAFTVRMALPGFLADEVTVTAETLRIRPPDEFLGVRDLGYAAVGLGGPGWPETIRTDITLRRLGGTDPTPSGRFGSSFNLYESDEIVLLVSDPRAVEAYKPQGSPEEGADEEELPEIDSEAGQCRRCERPAFLTDQDAVTELFAGGRFLRVRLDVESNALLRQAFPDDRLVPAAVVELAGWADDVPSPSQVSLTEPVQNPATWSPGDSAFSVSFVSGELLTSTTDHAVEGRALGFSLERHYRSSLATFNPLGRNGWTSNLFAHLRENRITGEVEYHDGRGHVWRVYPKTAPEGREKPAGDLDGHFWAEANAYDLREALDFPDSRYHVPLGLPIRLERLGRTGWRLYGLHNDSVVFDAEGRLVEYADRLRQRAGETQEQGNRVRLFYDAFGRLDRVEDEYGRTYRLRYTEISRPTDPRFGLLEEVEDFAGRRITYHYDSSGGADSRVLDKVELPEVTGSVVAGTVRPSISYTFDPADFGEDVPLHGPLSGGRLKSYKLPGRTRDTETIGWDETSGRVETLSSPRATRSWSLEWLENEQTGQVKQVNVTSPTGLIVQQHVNTLEGHAGRVWKTVQHQVPALDATDSLPSWSGGDSPPSVTPKDLETSINYTTSGRVEFVRLPDGSGVRTEWRDENRLAEATVKRVSVEKGSAPQGNALYEKLTTDYDYSAGVDNLAGGYSEFEGEEPGGDADARTHLIPVVTIEGQGSDPLPVTESHTSTRPETPDSGKSSPTLAIVAGNWFDRFGQLLTRTDGQTAGSGGATGAIAQRTTYTYSTKVPANPVGSGYLESVEIGDEGSKLKTQYEYDPRGTVSKILTKDGDTVLFSKTIDNDEWGRPYIVTSGQRGRYPAAERTLTTTYDLSGRVTKQTWTQAALPDGVASIQYQYDDRDRLEWVQYTNLAGETPGTFETRRLTYAYDDQTGLVTSVTSPGGVTESYQYDGLGRPIRTSVGSSGPRFSAYDSMGRLVWQSDGDDGYWRGAYDAWGRLFREVFPDGTYVGRSFDVGGAVRREDVYIPPEGEGDSALTLARTDYHYTSVGQPWFVLRYSGPGAIGEFDDYSYDSAGRQVSVTHSANDGSAPDLVTTTAYLADGSGRIDTVTDPAGNITDYDYTGGAPWPSSVTLSDQVPATGVTLTTTYRMDYDAQGRVVTTSRDSDSLTVSRTFDEVGNQLSEKFSNGDVPQEVFMAWDAAGRMVWRTGDGGRATTYGYDADGRLVKETVTRRNGAQETTEYDHDAAGRLAWREIPGRRRETFTYNPDDTLDVWTTALANGPLQLRLKHLYDPAGRVIRRYVDNPEDFASPPTGLATLTNDLGDAWEHDRLGRMLTAGRVAARGADGNSQLDQLGEPSLITYAFREGDPRDLPKTETIGYLGSWWNNVPGAITRHHGTYGDLTGWTGPANIGSFTTTPDALLRRSTVTWRPAPENSTTGAYSWGGTARLMTADALGQSLVNGYGAPGTRLASRGAGLNGVALGNLAFTWDGPSNLKERRAPTSALGGLDVFGGQDWVWTQRDGARLGVGDSSTGVFEYEYGAGDELAFARYEGTVRQYGVAGFLGRPATLTSPDGDESFGYDSVGRRTLDGRHRYTWSWRGELTEVEVVDPESELLGHRVTYGYDASGRLAEQTHFNAAGAEVDSRRFVWNDGELVAQVGLNHDDKVLWTVEHLPGPVGYDDSPVVRVTTGYSEYVPDPPPTARDYHLIRDEMGSVVAVFRGEATGAGEPPPLVARILYSPYGDAHLEPGPELLSVDHDLSLRSLDGIDQLEVPTTDVEGEEVPAAVPGAMVFTFSLAMTVDSVSDAATLARWVADEDGERWVDEAPDAYVVALDPGNPRRLAVMPVEPWEQSTRYRVTVRNVLRDGFGRTVIFPDRRDIYETELTVSAAPCEEVRFEGYPKRYPLTFDTVAAAAEWFQCQPVPLDPDDPPDPEADPEQCFPGGLNLLFQGLWHDPVTGLAYARNRWYDARTAHWLTPDPMGAFDSPNQYAFVAWGPERYSDPTGEWAEDLALGGPSFLLGAHSLRSNLREGNIGWAAVDAIGMAVDAAAIAIPGLPGGVGFGIKGARGATALYRARRAVKFAEYIDQGINVGQGLYQARDDFADGHWVSGSLNLTMSGLGMKMAAKNPWQVTMSNRAGMGLGGATFRHVDDVVGGGRTARTLITHRGGNRQVMVGENIWHLPKGRTIEDIPLRDPLGDQLQAAATEIAGGWHRSFLSDDYVAAIRRARAKGRGYLAPVLEARAKGQYVERMLKMRFPDLPWSSRGVDVPGTMFGYEILSGTASNMIRHGRRSGMTSEFYRMIRF